MIRKFQLLALSTLCLLFLLAAVMSQAQITPSQDAYTDSATANKNYGSSTLLDVNGATDTTYIQFNLASIPSGAIVSQATLKLYVNAVTTAGSFNVNYVNGAWVENTITYNMAPAMGGPIASNVAITAADKNQYVLINITPAVVAWLNGSQANDGIALVANSGFNASFDSKENTGTSHPAELDIFAGDGTITGVTTASGSGLTGGGTSGILNLALTNECAANQVLQWSGSAWACAAVGMGTVTSVGSGLGLTGGPITGSGTLSINTSVVPQLAAANTFTGNQTVNGNLSATGVVSGSGFQIGTNLFDYGSYGNANAFLGFSGNTSTTSLSFYNTASGFQALYSNVGDAHGNGWGNTASGGYALGSNTMGKDNTATGYQALYENNTGNYNTASGAGALFYNSIAYYNTAAGAYSGAPADGSQVEGSYNTFIGAQSRMSTGTLSNATAIGAGALVSASNAMVLGSINGVNGAAASTNVGIGTTAPMAALDVAGHNLETFIGNPSCGANPFAAIAFGTSGFYNCQNYALLGDSSGSTYLNAPYDSLYFRVNNATLMMVTSFGQVGINTVSPDTYLTVNGNADKPGGGSWGTFSDRRLKTLDGSFDSGLSQILKINPIRYRYKEENAMGIRDREEHIGLVAQDVQKVIPEAVTENNKGYLLVNNDPIIWTMLNAIKEQQALIRKQQAQIARLSSQVKAIRASLKTNGRTGAEVHAVKTQVSVVHQ